VDRGVAGGKCAGKRASGCDHSAHACASANGDSNAGAGRADADICTTALIPELLQGLHHRESVRRHLHRAEQNVSCRARMRM